MKKKIVIVGLGLIGGSLAKALTERAGCFVCGMDQNPEVEREALVCGAIAKAAEPRDLADADILYLCVYPQAAIDFVRRHAGEIGKGCIVTDTCGIKNAVCPALKALAEEHGFLFVGGHPMAGKEKNGFAVSEASLFDGASYLLVPCGAPDQAVETMKSLAMQMGFGGTVVTTPEHHDEMIAFTSQLPHVLACAYVMSPCCPQHNGFSAGSYRDVSRVARINETLWTELFLDNREALSKELDTLISHISQINDAVKQNDPDALRSLLRRGREIKEALGE